ncbi:MAG: PD-(D/E)XK nuclease family protein, partial [Candidatus Brocadiia bacterium]
PRPGCLHVDHLLSGGHSGRGHTFLLGLDDSRFPGAGLQDPLLLDSERRKLSPELPTAAGRLKEKLVEFVRLLARLRGTVTLSFPCQSVVEDRELFPSSAVLAAYRLISGNREGEQQDLLKWLPAPVSFAPCDSAFCLDATEWWLWRLTEPEPVTNARELVRSRFPHLARGEQAAAARGADAFTPHDGHVPEADQDLDPTQETGRVMSSNGLQTIGQCPRKYFFKYGLNIAPPEDVPMDPDQWLDGLAFGSLIHELFEGFVREVIADGRVPQFRADYPRLRELLQEKVREYQGLYPPLNDASFQRRVAELEQTARTFLREDERYCQHTHSVPAYLEASIGMPPDGHGTDLDTLAPVSLTLPNGKVIRVRGRVDRIDRIGNGAVHTYGIWDYKSGSTWGYDRADPLRQGRKVQPFIYMTVVGHRLREKIDCQARVEYFGFFFPGVRAVGERLQWTPSELAGGGQVLQNLCQVVADGVFVATNDHEQDCTYCDYQGICGDVETLSATVNRMLECPENRMLDPFRNLRR